MIIDGTDLILGRVASFAAKTALKGEPVAIVNCESICISGNKDAIQKEFKHEYNRGHAYHGPFRPKMADRILRRAIRGMLPYKKQRGIGAFKKIKCYLGVPAELKSQKLETIKGANISKLSTINYLKISEVSKHLGK